MWMHLVRNVLNVYNDKKILTPPSIRICPLFGELKKGDFFTPLPPVWTNVSFSAIYFLEGIPYSFPCKMAMHANQMTIKLSRTLEHTCFYI